MVRLAACISALAMLGWLTPAAAGPVATLPDWQCQGPPVARQITTEPVARKEGWWRARLAETNLRLAAERFDIAFLGDSLTQRWDEAAWRNLVGGRSAVNLGFNGDRTETLLWRLDHGELQGHLPRAFVLLIGTNNLGRHHAPLAVADGIRAIIDRLRAAAPRAPILLVAIPPRGAGADAPFRRPIDTTNRLIARCAERPGVLYVDPGPVLLDAQGRLTAAVAPDQLHFSALGYQRLAELLGPALARLPIE
ncbi:MAG: GDSL-type esterase/lipase family protein [Dongiaceae bacterium]